MTTYAIASDEIAAIVEAMRRDAQRDQSYASRAATLRIPSQVAFYRDRALRTVEIADRLERDS